MEKLTFKKRRDNDFKSGKSIGVSDSAYEGIKRLSDQTGLTMAEVASDLVTYALEHVELTD